MTLPLLDLGMSPKAEWINFTELPNPGKKTLRFGVAAKADGFSLGTVSWYGPWRCYGFTPTLASPVVFEHRCLRDLAAFCEWLTTKHRAGIRTRR